jgi:hypothetical protein
MGYLRQNHPPVNTLSAAAVQASRSAVVTLCGMVGRTGHWSRLLLVVGVVTIALSVLAMHQLAVNHTFSAPTSSGWRQADHHSASQRGEPHAPLAGSDQPALAVVSDDVSCAAGCSADDDVSVAACLLALTLLVLCWRLAPPQLHPLPAGFPSRPLAPALLAPDRRTALSLAELSVRRT